MAGKNNDNNQSNSNQNDNNSSQSGNNENQGQGFERANERDLNSIEKGEKDKLNKK